MLGLLGLSSDENEFALGITVDPSRPPVLLLVIKAEQFLSHQISGFGGDVEVVAVDKPADAMGYLASNAMRTGAVVASEDLLVGSDRKFFADVASQWPLPMRYLSTRGTDLNRLCEVHNRGGVERLILEPWQRETLEELKLQATSMFADETLRRARSPVAGFHVLNSAFQNILLSAQHATAVMLGECRAGFLGMAEEGAYDRHLESGTRILDMLSSARQLARALTREPGAQKSAPGTGHAIAPCVLAAVEAINKTMPGRCRVEIVDDLGGMFLGDAATVTAVIEDLIGSFVDRGSAQEVVELRIASSRDQENRSVVQIGLPARGIDLGSSYSAEPLEHLPERLGTTVCDSLLHAFGGHLAFGHSRHTGVCVCVVLASPAAG